MRRRKREKKRKQRRAHYPPLPFSPSSLPRHPPFLTILHVTGLLEAGRTHAEPTVMAHPVEVEECGRTCVTKLPNSLHCPLPYRNDCVGEGGEEEEERRKGKDGKMREERIKLKGGSRGGKQEGGIIMKRRDTQVYRSPLTPSLHPSPPTLSLSFLFLSIPTIFIR